MSLTVSHRSEFESGYIQDHALQMHRYMVEITVDNPEKYEQGQVAIDYRDLARYFARIGFDGAVLINGNPTPAEKKIADAMVEYGIRVAQLPNEAISVEGICERIAIHMQYLLSQNEPGVRVLEVKLRETKDAYATWKYEPKPVPEPTESVSPESSDPDDNKSNDIKEGETENGVQES